LKRVEEYKREKKRKRETTDACLTPNRERNKKRNKYARGCMLYTATGKRKIT